MILVRTDHPYLRVGRHNHTVTALTALRPPAPVTAAPHGPSGLILHVNGQGKFSTLVLPPPRHVHRFATSPTITVALSTITIHRHRLSSPSKPVESTPPPCSPLRFPPPSSSSRRPHRRCEYFFLTPSSFARAHHRLTSSDLLQPHHHFEENRTSLLFVYDSFFTAGDLSSAPPSSPSPPLSTSSLPTILGEPPLVHHPKIDVSCCPHAHQPVPHRPLAGRICPVSHQRREGDGIPCFSLPWDKRPVGPGYPCRCSPLQQ
jgi:hypothetical protein